MPTRPSGPASTPGSSGPVDPRGQHPLRRGAHQHRVLRLPQRSGRVRRARGEGRRPLLTRSPRRSSPDLVSLRPRATCTRVSHVGCRQNRIEVARSRDRARLTGTQPAGPPPSGGSVTTMTQDSSQADPGPRTVAGRARRRRRPGAGRPAPPTSRGRRAWRAIAVAANRTAGQMGPVRAAGHPAPPQPGARVRLHGLRVARPGPEHRSFAEFCENGAKAVAEEGTTRRADRAFFAAHPVVELAHAGATSSSGSRAGSPSRWCCARAARTTSRSRGTTRSPSSPARCAASTRRIRRRSTPAGRASNEAAFALQLFARAFGTNNLPDCSNMCHESTSVALAESIGIGKGSVSLDDIHEAELIVIAGQNPGTNHPRMLSALEKAKEARRHDRRGQPAARDRADPLRQPADGQGAHRAWAPRSPTSSCRSGSTATSRCSRRSARCSWRRMPSTSTSSTTTPPASRPGATTSRTSTGMPCCAPPACPARRSSGWPTLFAASRAHGHLLGDGHHPAPQRRRDDQEITNVALLQGNIGKPGAGLCPVRGHSNVQGDRTMGIWEKLPAHFAERLRQEFGFDPPRERGHDVVNTVRALKEGEAQGAARAGRQLRRGHARQRGDPRGDALARPQRPGLDQAQPHPRAARAADARCCRASGAPRRTCSRAGLAGRHGRGLDVERAPLGGPQRAGQPAPALRAVDRLPPRRGHAGLAARGVADRLGRHGRGLHRHPAHIGHVVPGCDAYDEKVKRPGGFVLPHPPRDTRTFETPSGRAQFAVSPLEVLEVPDGHLLLQTLRSHDQFNTTIYGHDDRYRGLAGGRRVVMVHPDDLARLGWRARAARRRRLRVGGRLGAGRPRLPGGRRTPRRAAAPPPTTPSATCSCRSTRSPPAATARRRSRSSCGSSLPARRRPTTRAVGSRRAATTRTAAGSSRPTSAERGRPGEPHGRRPGAAARRRSQADAVSTPMTG